MLREIIYFFVMAFCLLLWLAYCKKISKPLHILGVFVLLNFPLEMYAWFLLEHGTNNAFIYHLQSPLEFTAIALYLRTSFPISFHKKVLAIVILVCIVCFALFSFFVVGLSKYNSYTVMLYNLVLIALALLVLLQLLLDNINDKKMTSKPIFWVCLACLGYYPGNMIINALITTLYRANPTAANTLWTADYVFNTSLYVFFAIAFMVDVKAKKHFKKSSK